MSVTTQATTFPSRATRPATSLPRTTGAVGAGAAVLTVAVAAAAHGAGVPFAVDGQTIPLLGFGQMTLLGAVIGGVVLAMLNRWSDVPRRRFLQATVVLTALSCVPSVALPPDATTKAVLVTLHVLAAAIIVPVLARHAEG